MDLIQYQHRLAGMLELEHILKEVCMLCATYQFVCQVHVCKQITLLFLHSKNTHIFGNLIKINVFKMV